MERVIIVHGWGATPEDEWYPWLRSELEKRKITVIMPQMPDTMEPKMDSWVEALSEVTGKINEETFFVGHSIGCQTIMRYLSTIQGGKVGGMIFVAGWLNLSNLSAEEAPIAKPWIEKPIDYKRVAEKTNRVSVFLSSNEPYAHQEENKKWFEDKLGAEVIIEPDMGHFTKADGITKMPEIIELLEDWM